jgi:hypothetical protein
MKVRAILLASVLLSGTFLLAGVSASAANSFTCSGSFGSPEAVPGGTYSSLSVPAHTVCTISAPVKVQSPMTIGSQAGLALLSGGSLSVAGGVTVESAGVFGDDNNAARITINGVVQVENDAAFVVGVETPGGPLVSSMGSVTGHQPSTVQIHNSHVGGSVLLTDGGAVNLLLDKLTSCSEPCTSNNFNDLEDNNIVGSVSQTGYLGVWSGILRDRIQGPLTFSNNVETPTDEYDIGSDVIFGGATCNHNNPAPNMGGSPGSPSVVHGQTTGNQAATCTGV